MIPRPWSEVALTCLPGGVLLAAQLDALFGTSARPWTVLSAVVCLLGAASLLVAAAGAVRRRSARIPAWGLVSLGLLVALALAPVLDVLMLYSNNAWPYFATLAVGAGLALPAVRRWPRRIWAGVLGLASLAAATPALTAYGYEDPVTLSICALYFLLAIGGLLLARRNGFGAGLFFLSGGLTTTTLHLQPARFFWESPFWSAAPAIAATILLLILTPAWVLRSRGAREQAASLLLPLGVYVVALVLAVRMGGDLGLRGALSACGFSVILLLTLTAASVVYGLARAPALGAGADR